MKIGGKAKAGLVNQRVQEFQDVAQQNIQNGNFSEETSKVMTEALSKIKGLIWMDGKKEEKMPEVD